MKTFSIIIPLYNVSDTLIKDYFEKLLQSISLNLRCPEVRNAFSKIILINDKPTDNCKEMVYTLLMKYNFDKIAFITNDINRGQAYSRNYGASIATSDYLHFIDQDDFISDNFYSLFLSTVEKYSFDVILSKCNLLFSPDNICFDPYRKKTKLYFSNADIIKDLRYFLLSNVAFSPGQYLISRNLFSSVEGFLDLRNKGTDDWGIWMRLIYFFPKATIKFCTSSVFYYRIHKDRSIKRLNMLASHKEQFKILADKVNHIYLYILKFFKINSCGRLISTFIYSFVFYRRIYLKK